MSKSQRVKGSSIPDATDGKAGSKKAVESEATGIARIQIAEPSLRPGRRGAPPVADEVEIAEVPIVVASGATGQGREAAGIRPIPRG